jgi:hypothetical protein
MNITAAKPTVHAQMKNSQPRCSHFAVNMVVSLPCSAAGSISEQSDIAVAIDKKGAPDSKNPTGPNVHIHPAAQTAIQPDIKSKEMRTMGCMRNCVERPTWSCPYFLRSFREARVQSQRQAK